MCDASDVCDVRFPALERLDLSGCPKVVDADLAPLTQLTALKWLRAAGCQEITDQGLVHLVGLSNLAHLDLTNCCKVGLLTVQYSPYFKEPE